jgi:hypothetical protein
MNYNAAHERLLDMLLAKFIGLVALFIFAFHVVGRVVRSVRFSYLREKSRREEYNRLGMHVINRHVIYDSSEYWH